MRQLAFLGAALTLIACGSRVLADAKNPTYEQDVLPIVKQSCANCHGNDKQKGGLNLATYQAMKQGGSSGEVVKPGDPGKSRIYTLAAHLEEPKMPPKGNKIADGQLATIKLWIEQGARENAGSKAAVMPKNTEISLKSVVKGRPPGPPPMPIAGKLRQEPVVVARRAGSILALATSPWAPLLAIGGQKQVILYNTDTGSLLGFIPFEHGQINSIRFSRNARFLLVAGGRGGQSGKAVLYKVEDGTKVLEVGIESDAILAADISADQTQIAVGSPSKLIRIYSTADGKVLHEIKKHTDWVTAVEYSPDGVLLATGDRNGGTFVWEAFTGREYFALRGHTARITEVSWRDDSNVLATASEDSTVKLWEMENGRNIRSWGAHAGGTASVMFAHDGKLVTTGRDKVTKLWGQNGAVQKSFSPFSDLGLRVAITHDNAKVIAGDWSGAVKAWKLADAKAVGDFDANPLPRAERLKKAEAAVTALTAKVATAQATFNAAAQKAKAAADSHTAAVAKLNKINADLAAAKKAATDFTAAANKVKPLMDAAKVEVDKATPLVAATASKAAAIEVVASAEAVAAKTIADAAAKAPANAELAARSRSKATTLQAINKELAAAKMAQTVAAAAHKAAQERYTAQSKLYADATAKAAANQKAATLLASMVKPATDGIAPAKAALDAANKALAPTKAALDAAGAELATAKSALEQLKATATATK